MTTGPDTSSVWSRGLSLTPVMEGSGSSESKCRGVLRLTRAGGQQVARISSGQVCCPCRGRLAWQG